MYRYRSLVVWQRAHALSVRVIRVTDHHWHPRCKGLFDQFRRAAVSIEANIVEGYALNSTAQFLRHFRIALGSAAEAESLLELVTEVGYLPSDECDHLKTQLMEVLRLLFGLTRQQAGRVTRPKHAG